MAESKIKTLSVDAMVRNIETTLRVQRADKLPCYTLVLGSGISRPMVPVGYEFVREALRWLYWRRKGTPDEFKKPDGPPADALQEFEAEIWSKTCASVKAIGGQKLPENPKDDASVAYRALMECQSPALSTPHLRRSFFQDVVGKAEGKLNAAHIYLAGLLSEQSRWKKLSPFCSTVFTTNLDPFLQKSLQLAQQLYLLSDKPYSVERPEDDGHGAVHLFYAHGSIFQYFLCNSEEEIQAYIDMNSPLLTGYFQTHGVIVVGYSGWNDVLMAALKSCQQFKHNLYWCDLKDPEHLSERAKEFLRGMSASAMYVKITDADVLMKKLYLTFRKADGGDDEGDSIGADLPRFVADPLTGLIEQFESIRDVADVKTPASSDSASLQLPQHQFRDQIDHIIRRLTSCRDNLPVSPAQDAKSLLLRAAVHLRIGDIGKAIALCGEIQQLDGLSSEDAAGAYRVLGIANARKTPPDYAAAIAQFTNVIEMSDAPTDEKAAALCNRGITRGLLAPPAREKAICDYTAVIEMSDASAEKKARALNNRGATYTQLTPPATEKAIGDFTAVIEMSDATADVKAVALYNRGIAYGELTPLKRDKEIADYTAVIEMSDAPADQKAKALNNRGVAYGKLTPPATDKTIADFTAVIEMLDAPADQKAAALNNRGVVYGKLMPPEPDKAIADYAAVIEMSDAPADQKAAALNNRGGEYRRLTPPEPDKAISDYTTVMEMSEVSAEQKARALNNRGVAYGELTPPKSDKAIADYTAVMEMSDAPAEGKACARGNLAWAEIEQGNYEVGAELTRVALEDDPKQRSIRANLGYALLHLGRIDEAREQYQRVIDDLEDSAELEGIALEDLRNARERNAELPGLAEMIQLVQAAVDGTEG